LRRADLLHRGIWREMKDIGEAFTMLTMEPASTSFPIAIGRSSFLPAGTLSVEQVV